MNPIHIFPVLLLALLSSVAAANNPWEAFHTPYDAEPEAIGGYANGCLTGGEAIEPDGRGYQVVRLSRNRYYGNPELIDYIEELAKKIDKKGLGLMLVADMAMPRGGPFTRGHRSHQTGLDADIWLPLNYTRELGNRDKLESISMVDHDNFVVNREHWSEAQTEMLRLAASDKRVARIFVHPAIKAELCRTAGKDRAWLNRIRPWWKHDSHFHVRLHCPDGDSSCKSQDPPPPGDGCGAELASWFPENQKPQTKKPPRTRPPLPMQCQQLLSNSAK